MKKTNLILNLFGLVLLIVILVDGLLNNKEPNGWRMLTLAMLWSANGCLYSYRDLKGESRWTTQ